MLSDIWHAIVRFLEDRGFSLGTYAPALHLFFSLLLVVMIKHFAKIPLIVVILIVLGIGLAKEWLWDMVIRRGSFDWHDMAWDSIGVALGTIFIL